MARTSNLETALSLTSAAASWGVRWNAYVFLRLLPFASRFMPRIWSSLAVSLATSALILVPSSNSTAGNHKHPAWSSRAIQLVAGSTRSSDGRTSYMNLAINLLCTAMCLDFIYRSHYLLPSTQVAFSRMGYVTHDSARIALRSDGGEIRVTYESEGEPLQAVSASMGSSDTDQTTELLLEGLRSDTIYHYNTSTGLEGTFTTRRAPEHISRFSILSTSCQKPNWPYSPLNHPLRIQGMEHLDQYLASSGLAPEMMLFLGDFIYSDLPMPVAPYTLSYYRELYRQIYASPSWTPRLRSIPWMHMFDDHEIINDFAPSSSHASLYSPAMQAYNEYQASVNPAPLVPSQPTYTSFNIGQVSFFVLDNRSYRDIQPNRPAANSTAGTGKRSMLGQRQLEEVRKWVRKEGEEEGRLLVLVSGVPVTRNWSEGKDEFDSWAGYLDEREIILELLWGVGGAVIISGDRHEHATTLFPPPVHSVHPPASAVIEFSTSPLSFFHQPWLREHVPHPPTDVTIHHEWRGTSRFGVFEFAADEQVQQVVFKLMVDGQQNWEYTWVKGRDIFIP